MQRLTSPDPTSTPNQPPLSLIGKKQTSQPDSKTISAPNELSLEELKKLSLD